MGCQAVREPSLKRRDCGRPAEVRLHGNAGGLRVGLELHGQRTEFLTIPDFVDGNGHFCCAAG